MGVKVENIRQGLRTFDTSFFQVPGRTNVYDEHPFKVLFDYGHNPAAVKAMTEFAQRLECSGRRLCVLAAPGDRRDEDIRAIARAAGGAFDHFILRRDDNLRGRESDEVPRMLEAELLAMGVPASHLTVIPDEQASIEAALRMARTGDQLLIFADAVTRSWKQVIYFKPVHEAAGVADGRGARRAPVAAVGVADTTGDALLAGAEVIQDERGVRLARPQDD